MNYVPSIIIKIPVRSEDATSTVFPVLYTEFIGKTNFLNRTVRNL